jgi:hypothetical protein
MLMILINFTFIFAPPIKEIKEIDDITIDLLAKSAQTIFTTSFHIYSASIKEPIGKTASRIFIVNAGALSRPLPPR